MHVILPWERRYANQSWDGPIAEEDVQMVFARESENVFVFVSAHVSPGETEKIAKLMIRKWPFTGVSLLYKL